MLLGFMGMVVYADVDASGYDHDAPTNAVGWLHRTEGGPGSIRQLQDMDHEVIVNPAHSRPQMKEFMEAGHLHPDDADLIRADIMRMGGQYAAGYGPCKYAPKPAPLTPYVDRDAYGHDHDADDGLPIDQLPPLSIGGPPSDAVARDRLHRIAVSAPRARDNAALTEDDLLKRRIKGGNRAAGLPYAEQTEGERFHGTLPASQRPRPYVPHGKATATMIDLEQARRKATEKGASRGAAGTRIYPGTPITDAGEAEYAETPDDLVMGIARPSGYPPWEGQSQAREKATEKAAERGHDSRIYRLGRRADHGPRERFVVNPEDRTEFQASPHTPKPAGYAATPREELYGVSLPTGSTHDGVEAHRGFSQARTKAEQKATEKGLVQDAIYPFGRLSVNRGRVFDRIVSPEDRTEFQEVLDILTYQMTGGR